MSTNKENKLMPRLRFPEFKNDGEWEVKRLGKIGETINGLSGKSASDFGTGKLYITYMQIFKNSVIDFKECGRVRIFENEKQNKIKKGDILFTASSETPDEVGFASVIIEEPKEDIYLNSFCFALRPFEEKILNEGFSRYLFQSSYYRKNVSKISQGSTRFNLSKKAFLDLKIPVPSLPEQQKIAACLSSLDELIAAERQKLDVLKAHKKGLLQNLFPQEGETVPKLRFKEFKESGEWEVKRLGEVFTFISTKSYSRDQLNYENGIIKNIHYGDIHTKFKSLFDVTKESVPFLNSEVIQKSKINDEQYCREGDLIFVDASEDLNDIGKCIEIINTNDEKIVAGLHTLHARQKEKFLTLKFGAYLFQSSLTRGQIQRESQGAKVLGISASRMKKIMLIIPSLSEQQKIAACLSSLDEFITAQTQKIELLQQHKKGLLQGLFPAIVDTGHGLSQ